MKTWWKVPLFCAVAGIVTFYAIVYLFGRFALITLPDGSITVDRNRQLVIYGIIFVVTLAVGGLVFFRNMTRKEIFISASVIVAFGLIMNLIQFAFQLTTGPSAVLFAYADELFEWSDVISQLLIQISDNLWLGAFVGSLTPYLFIPFGKKGQA